jgi:hypothetical protein
VPSAEGARACLRRSDGERVGKWRAKTANAIWRAVSGLRGGRGLPEQLGNFRVQAVRIILLLVTFCLLCAPGHASESGADALGYLQKPEALEGLWENQHAPQFFLEFSSSNEYRRIYAETGITLYYNRFKIFHITDGGLVYALVRSVGNPHQFDKEHIAYHFPDFDGTTLRDINRHYASGRDDMYLLKDPDIVREMTEEEIRDAPDSEYYYVLFDLSDDLYYYDCGVQDGCFFVFYKICQEHLINSGFALSRNDFDRPAAEHWERVKPGNGCKYRGFSSHPRPKHFEYVPYGYWPQDDGTLLPWEARARIRKERAERNGR